jgi:hypothetical protein
MRIAQMATLQYRASGCARRMDADSVLASMRVRRQSLRDQELFVTAEHRL